MKFKSFFMTLLVALALVACKDKQSGPMPYAGDASGSYKGKSIFAIMGKEYGDVELTLKFTKEADGKYSVLFPAMEKTISGEGVPGGTYTAKLADVTLKGVEFMTENGVVFISPVSEQSVTASDGKAYKVSIASGELKGNDLSMVYTVVPGSMPMPITFTFSGAK